MRSMTEQQPVGRTSLGAFTEALASKQAAPGGGAAAAVAATMAASLTAMVLRLSVDRPKYQQHAPLHAEALGASDSARLRFLELADEDATAYAAYRAARTMPHDTEAQTDARDAATRDAARGATEVPLALVAACHMQMELVERLTGRTNLYVASDLEVAALLLEGAARGGAANVTANLGSVGDEGYARAVTAELDQRLQQIQRAADQTRERIAQGGPRKPEGT
jgi:formiminotetrahydrofolate cyclodeaminase